MGQANQRGNFAERQSAAYDTIERTVTEVTQKRVANIEALDAIEKQSTEQADAFARQLIVAHWKYSDISHKVRAFASLDPKLFVVTDAAMPLTLKNALDSIK
jgi:hypothetical protein